MTQHVRRIALHIGRRGAFLTLFGCIYLLLGYSYIGTPVTPAVHHSLRMALNVAPLVVYGWLWVTSGVAAIVVGLIFRASRDVFGFIAAVLMPSLWAVVYFAAWMDGDVPRGWVTGLLFALIASAVGVVAGMPEPPIARIIAESRE